MPPADTEDRRGVSLCVSRRCRRHHPQNCHAENGVEKVDDHTDLHQYVLYMEF